MNSGGALIDRFVAQELDDSVRSILKDAFDERMGKMGSGHYSPEGKKMGSDPGGKNGVMSLFF